MKPENTFSRRNQLVIIIFLAAMFSTFDLPAQNERFISSKNKKAVTNITEDINGPTPWQVVGNLYSQPYISTQVGRNKWDWYGSGDVNNDEVIDNRDKTAILGSTSDRADLDGDGFPGTNQDKTLLTEFLNGTIPYLPGHWDELRTKQERIDWINKVLAIQDMTPYINNPDNPFICANYITQMGIDFHGISNIDVFVQKIIDEGGVEYNPEHNARFNLPFYYVHTKNAGGEYHAVGGFFVGDGSDNSNNVLNFDDFYFVSYLDQHVVPGTFHMHEDSFATLALQAYLENNYLPGNYFFSPIDELVKFDLNGGVGTLVSYRDSIKAVGEPYNIPFVILDNPNDDVVEIFPLEDITVDAGGYPLHYQFTAPALSLLGYNSIPQVAAANTPLEPEILYSYSDTVYTGGYNYSFTVTAKGIIESGGVIHADSTKYKVNVDFTTGVTEPPPSVTRFELKQNYPNPFGKSSPGGAGIATIEYSIPGSVSAVRCRLSVYNVLGDEIAKLVDETKTPGNYSVRFSSEKISAGVYFYVLQAGGFIGAKKMTLIK